VKPENARDLVSQADVDGALVGGASLDIKAFLEIISKSRPATV
jgi:triosephosphate isomerase